MDSHRLIKFTDAPFLFFFSKISSHPLLLQLLFLGEVGGAGEEKELFSFLLCTFLLYPKSIIFLLFFSLSFMLDFPQMSANLLMSLHFGKGEIKLLIGSYRVLI